MANKLADMDKSLALAECIQMMKIPILTIDLDYLKDMVDRFYEQASFEDSAAVLNPQYSPIKSGIIRKQAKAMSLLYEYIETLKDIDKDKEALGKEKANRDEIMKLFL